MLRPCSKQYLGLVLLALLTGAFLLAGCESKSTATSTEPGKVSPAADAANKKRADDMAKQYQQKMQGGQH